MHPKNSLSEYVFVLFVPIGRVTCFDSRVCIDEKCFFFCASRKFNVSWIFAVTNLIDSTWLDLTKMFADKKAVVAKYEMTAVHYFGFTFELVFTLNQNKGFFVPSPKVLTSLIPLDKTIKCSVGDNRRKPSSNLSSKGFVSRGKRVSGIILMTNDNILSPINFYGTRSTLIATFSPFLHSPSLPSLLGRLKTLVHEKTCKFFQFHGPNRRRNKNLIAKICWSQKFVPARKSLPACLMAANRRCGLRASSGMT